MFLNKNLSNGVVILLLVLIGFLLARTNTLGAFLLPSVIGGVAAIFIARTLLTANKKDNT